MWLPAALVLTLGAGSPPLALEGIVTGPGKRPVARARVLAQLADRSGTPLAARTDEHGAFRIAVTSSEPWTLYVDPPPPLAPLRVPRAVAGTPLAVTLEKGVTLDGVVRDGASGKPISLARVEARDPDWPADEPRRFDRTDAAGRFHIGGLGRGVLRVSASASGFGETRRDAIALQPIELLLFPGSAVSGQVRDPGGKGIAGATVRVENEIPGDPSPRPVIADGSGRYEVMGIDPGAYRVIAVHPDFAPALAAGVEVDAGGARVDLTLDRGATLRGRLVTRDAERDVPVGGRVLVAEWDARPVPPSLAAVFTAEAGEDGRFELARVPAGTLVLGASAAAHGRGRAEIVVRADDLAVDVGDVRLDPGRVIRGRVTDEKGAGLSGARVQAWGGSGQPAEGRTGEGGAFLIAGAPVDTRFVNAELPGFAPAWQRVRLGEDVEIVLRAGARAHGRVVDEQGRAVPAFTAWLEPSPDDDRMPVHVAGTDGAFEMVDAASGAWIPHASAPEHPVATGPEVTLMAGSDTDLGVLRLSPGRTLRGDAVDASGVGVAGAQVSVDAIEGPSDWGGEATASTDSAGRFEVRGVSGGRLEVRAEHPGYAPGTVVVEPGAEAHLVLHAGGRVEGVVRGAADAIASCVVQVMPIAGDYPAFRDRAVASIRADGSFALDHVRAGLAEVAVVSGRGVIFTVRARQRVEVAEGATARVDIAIRDIAVSGRVTRGGVGVGGARLTFHGKDVGYFGPGGETVPPGPGPERDAATTRDDGTYDVVLGEAGGYLVFIEAPGASVARVAQVPDADTATLDFELPTTSVRGRVIRADTGEGVAGVRVLVRPLREHPTSGESGPDGSFQVAAVVSRSVVTALAQGFAPAQVEIDVDADGVSGLVLSLSTGESLSGRVVDAGGRGVGGVMVEAHAESVRAGAAPTDLAGAFTLGHLAPGAYVLQAGSAVAGHAVTVVTHPAEGPVVLRLSPGGRVRALVVDAAGRPLPGALVACVKVDGLAMRTVAGADGQGRVEVAVPAGRVTLQATGAESEAVATQELDVAAGAVLDVTFTFTVPLEE